VRISDRSHRDDLAVDEFDPIVLVEHAQVAEPVICLDGERPGQQA
jgi:hypothetical protein